MTKNDSALVIFSDDASSFAIFVPYGGTPLQISKVFIAMFAQLPVVHATYHAGQAAADFIVAIDPGCRVRLASLNKPFCKPLYDTPTVPQFEYTFSRNWHIGYKMGVKSGGQHLFQGNLSEFTKWATKYTGYDHLIKKIVQFNYDGGTEAGLRTVRVEAITTNDGYEIYLEGYDLNKDDLKEAYRKYKFSQIKSEIKPLN